MSDVQVLSFPVSVQNLPPKGTSITISTDAKERQALAQAHGLEEVKSFSAEFLLTRWKKSGVRIRGQVTAQIVQACVVTLEPVEAVIDTAVDTLFVPESSRLARQDFSDSGELLLDANGADIPELFSGDRIDIGAVAEEFFELAIDPYPRKEGVQIAEDAEGVDQDDMQPETISPFAILLDWRKKE